MTEIIEIVIFEVISLSREKNHIHICLIHVSKTSTSGCRICG
jgi:hypothetical protein